MGVVLLVRHGQASFGAADYDRLSAAGAEQGRLLGRALADRGLSPVSVLHGAMRRQADTAGALVEGGGWTVAPELDEGWNEFDHLAVVAQHVGGADAMSALDLRAFQRAFDEATARWSGGAHDRDYTEPWPAFLARVDAALDRALARPGPTVVVSSGGPIAVLCAALIDPAAGPEERARLWRAFNTVTVNASVTRVLEGAGGRRLLSFNEHGHLPRDLVTYR